MEKNRQINQIIVGKGVCVRVCAWGWGGGGGGRKHKIDQQFKHYPKENN